MEDHAPVPTETIEDLRRSFSYGSRSNLDFKYLKDLTDDEFGNFLGDLLAAVSQTIDDGDAERVARVAYEWQITGYSGHLGDPADFPHRHDDVPMARLTKPLSESTLTLLTSSGHFVDGDDPEPFGVKNMSQAEAESRIGEFIRTPPTLSTIPTDTPTDHLRVRHGGYPVRAVASDHQVALPLEHLRDLEVAGVIGAVSADAYSFTGATSQVRLKKEMAPAWAERLKEEGTDVVLLIPL